MRKTRAYRFFCITLMGLIVSFLLKIYWPPEAFGQVSLQTALNEAEKNYLCISSSREYPISELQELDQKSFQTEIVEKLTKQLASCIARNQNQISSVNLSQLTGVTYITKLLNNGTSAAIIAGVGRRDTNDIDLKSGLDSYSEGMAKFLVANGDQQDLSVTLNQKNFSREADKELLNMTKRFGKLVFHSQSSLELPDKLRLTGNRAVVGATLGIEHQLEGVNLPPHFQLYFKGNASDRDFLKNPMRKLGEIELTFNGLLLKGVPAYLRQNQALQELEKDGLILKTDSSDNSKATLAKTLAIPKDIQLDKILSEIKNIESKLSQNQSNLSRIIPEISKLKIEKEEAQKKGDLDLNRKLQEKLKKAETKLENVQNELQKNINNKYQGLANLPLKSKFICAPEFIREFKFPIYERKVSASGEGGSASAGIGVSGDVVIDINKPTCEFTFVPPFKGESSTYADVSITSNGYFGGRADASGEKDFGINFSSKKFGKFSLSNMEFSKQEKDVINGLVLKSLEDAENDQKILNDLAYKLEDEFIEPVISSIESALIGPDSAPLGTSQLCDLFTKVGKVPGSSEDLVCWALGLKIPKPSETLETITTMQENLQKALQQVDDQLTKGLKDVNDLKSKIDPLKNEIDNVDSEIRKIANKLNKKLCITFIFKKMIKKCENFVDKVDEYNKLSSQLSDIEKANELLITNKNQITKQVLDLQRRSISLTKAWEQYNSWVTYSSSKKIREVAKNFVHKSIFLSPIDTKSIAKELLNVAWDIEKGTRDVNEWIDLANKYLQSIIPDRLSISIAASGRVAFISRSHIVKTRPQVTTNSVLEFKDQKPYLNLKFLAYRNGVEADNGSIGGLDVIGLKFTAQQIACIGGKVVGGTCSSGKRIDLPQKSWELLTPTLGSTSVSKEEIKIFSDSVPLTFKS